MRGPDVGQPSQRDLRVALLHPGIYDSVQPFAFAPWGALCVREQLRASGVEAEAFDLNGSCIKQEVGRITATFAPTVWGLTAKLGNGARRLRAAIDEIRAISPEVTIAAGGPLVSTFPDPSSPVWSGVDALLLGDGEAAMPAWMAAGYPSGLVAPAQADLDLVGIPAGWPDLKRYVHPADSWPNFSLPGIHVASARGCTRRCTFCYLTTHMRGPRFRYVSNTRLAHDLDRLARRTGAGGFYFVDDCFLDRGNRLAGFAHEMAKRGNPYEFGCDVQLEDLSAPDQLEAMWAAGFRSLYLGIEAASERIRRRLGKSRVPKSVEASVNRALDLGFVVRASIGIGWPTETRDEMEQTLELIARIDRLAFDAYRFLPIPGTPEWSRETPATRKARAMGDLDLAAADFSEFNSNYSSLSDSEFDAIWARMQSLERDRLTGYFSGTLLERSQA